MIRIFFLGICVFLMILGLVESLKSLAAVILNKKNCSENSTIVIPISNHNEEIEFLLRKTISKVLWENKYMNTGIICLDCGMDFETRKICELICKDYQFVKLYNINDIDSKILLDNSL